jgi:hypothetical protein
LSTPPDLHAQARAFADRLSDLLNGTVANGVRVSWLKTPTGAIVGYNVSKTSPLPECVPVTLTAAKPRCYVGLAHTLTLDREGLWLTDAKSYFGLYLDPLPDRTIVRYDYEREPKHDYPSAHVQVHGESPHLRELGERLGAMRDLQRLHFPVGGKRFRPSIEDLIEFLVVEGIADARVGWIDVLQVHRRNFYVNQLRAAVRRDQEEAAEQLRREGWSVLPPAE